MGTFTVIKWKETQQITVPFKSDASVLFVSNWNNFWFAMVQIWSQGESKTVQVRKWRRSKERRKERSFMIIRSSLRYSSSIIWYYVTPVLVHHETFAVIAELGVRFTLHGGVHVVPLWTKRTLSIFGFWFSVPLRIATHLSDLYHLISEKCSQRLAGFTHDVWISRQS